MVVPKFHALVPAAGTGTRMGAEVPKQYLEIAGQPLIAYVLSRFGASRDIATVTVCLAPGDRRGEAVVEAFQEAFPETVCRVVPGGAERCHSVLNGLVAIALEESDQDWVLVHDAARPCLTDADLARLIGALEHDDVGGILATPVRDTLKRAEAEASNTPAIAATVSREGLWQALTPQMFRVGKLKAALEQALAAGSLVTDEAQAMELAGFRPRLVAGRTDNIKVTLPEDLEFAARTIRNLTGAGLVEGV